MKYLAPFLLLLLCPLLADAQELKVKGPKVKTYTVVEGFPFTVSAPTNGSLYRFSHPSTLTSKRKSNVLTITGGAKGTYTVTVDYSLVDWKKQTIEDRSISTVITIGDVPGPVPPGPVPPEPDPDVRPPLPSESLAVLIVEETKNKRDLPPDQLEILNSTPFREWARATVGKDSKQNPMFKIYDPDQSMENESKFWQDAMRKAKEEIQSLPWILITNGKTGFSGPLPATMDETKVLIQKYAK